MMPSAFEGFPNTILEAQSYGCIPFAFNSYGALDWIVNQNLDAKLIPPFEVETMALELTALASDAKLTMGYQEKAWENASRFTVDKVGKVWFQLFKEVRKKNVE
jgi:glycosyltransferase involved in cell wall biosynthesis